jgi:hypothetical protein
MIEVTRVIDNHHFEKVKEERRVLLNRYMLCISNLIQYHRQGDIIAAALVEMELKEINRLLTVSMPSHESNYTVDLVD